MLKSCIVAVVYFFVFVVVDFLLVNNRFLSFQLHYHTYHAQKQRNSNSIKPRINLNQNMQLNCGIPSNKAKDPQIKI